MISHDRRGFVRALGGLVATAGLTAARPSPAHAGPPPLAPPLGGQADEAYWQMVKEQFPLRRGLILMNAANLCPSPYPVIEAVTGYTRDIDRDASFQNRAKFGTLRDAAREQLARYLRVSADEIAITRNTSEGNNTVVNGLALSAGDEVVIWDQNHPTCNVAWDVRAQRSGFAVRRVTTPTNPRSVPELVAPFESAITGRTRVLAFSHVSNISGVALPAHELCQLARDRGILTLIDGAQVFGALRLDLHELGCDFYTGSTHKWFVGPKEVGVLYVRRERIDALWPSDVGLGWEQAVEQGARKLETLGQRDDAAVAAVGTTVTFHETIGPDRIETRVRDVAAALKSRLRAGVPGVTFHTPASPALSAGVVIFRTPRGEPRDLFETLYHEHGIAGAAMGGAFSGLRLSPHIYNTMADVDRVVEVITSMT